MDYRLENITIENEEKDDPKDRLKEYFGKISKTVKEKEEGSKDE